jgi:toxin HigB-1
VKNIFDVSLTRKALKDLKKVPPYISLKLQAWIEDVGHRGIIEVRKIPGYNDELLKGKRRGQRSIRLSRSYRAIYTIKKDGTVQFIEIIEVNKHEY